MNKAESGLQLLNRLNDRPSLNDFDCTLFPNGGPFPKEVIEITGDSNTGKTVLLTEIIAKAILPLENGGRNVGVILINTDYHFQIIKLITTMERIANNFPNTSKTKVENVIAAGLANLHIMEIHDYIELSITIKRLDGILAENSNITVLVVDSIAAYYWSEQTDKTIRMDTYYKKILKSLQENTWEYKTIIFYTRPAYFFTQNPVLAEKQGNNFWEHPKLEHINYRIKLEDENGAKQNAILGNSGPSREDAMALKNRTYIAKVQTFKTQYFAKYIIDERGIVWNP